MAIVMEASQNKRLEKFGIKTKTKYKSGDKILYRNSDGIDSEDVKEGIILEKCYYKNNVLLKKLYNFDSRVTYTYVLGNGIHDKSTCPNCGYESTVKDFVDGCCYCGTDYNINYLDKKLGGKDHYDRIVHSNLYKVITLIIDLIVSLIISYIYISSTSRTFNEFDIAKVFVYAAILGLFLYYVFYFVDAYVVLLPIKIYKDKQNEKQIKFWEKMKSLGVNKNNFFNNFNYELRKFYFGDENNNIIDYDIIDYMSFKENVKNNIIEVDVTVKIRLVSFINEKIKVETKDAEFKVRKAEVKKDVLKGLVNIINCPGCGHSVNAEDNSCSYCGTKFNYLQEWYLVKK